MGTRRNPGNPSCSGKNVNFLVSGFIWSSDGPRGFQVFLVCLIVIDSLISAMKKLAACTWIRKEWCDMESTLLGSSRILGKNRTRLVTVYVFLFDFNLICKKMWKHYSVCGDKLQVSTAKCQRCSLFGRYASCPQLVRCEARNVGPGTLVQGNVAGEVRERLHHLPLDRTRVNLSDHLI